MQLPPALPHGLEVQPIVVIEHPVRGYGLFGAGKHRPEVHPVDYPVLRQGSPCQAGYRR